MDYKLSEATAIYYQDSDTWDPGETQEIRLQSLDAGGGKYLVIETQRWALDAKDIRDFANFLSNWLAQHSED